MDYKYPVNHKTQGLSINVLDYVEKIGNRIPQGRRNLFNETTEKYPVESKMLTTLVQNELLKMLVKITNSKKAIEIGTFTGLSALSIADGLPDDGKLYAFDISEEYTNIAKQHWEINGVHNKIELVLGKAVETLKALPPEEEGTFDFAFVDANKDDYLNYFEILLKLLKPGGVMVYDNVLWKNQVADYENWNDPMTLMIRNFNDAVLKDERVEINMLPLADGIGIIRKK